MTLDTSINNSFSQIASNMRQDFVSYMIIAFICILLIAIIWYIIYLTNLQNSECNFMNGLYPSVDGNIKAINLNDPDCSGNLYDYYIKTAYNACSGGSYKNDFTNICNLKAVLKQGVRGLDFEIYSVDNTPVVATSTTGNFYVKETFNSVNFGDVMSTIQDYAFAGGTCPNPTDPIIIHLRIMSNNQQMYSNLANIFKSYDSLMLGNEYSYENNGQNLGSIPLTNFMGKIILIVDKTNNAFLENNDFLEYVNMTSNSVFMRALNYYDVKNCPDINELTNFNKTGMTIALPDSGTNPSNPSSVLCRASGCQMVAMRYQMVDNFLEENTIFFDEGGYAFVLKPIDLRYQQVTVPDPTPQNPAYSYGTRSSSTDFYSFNY
jgi:hypothetical protein